MTKNTEFYLDLAAATPAALQGYILSAMFDDWLKKLSDQDLLDAERAFERASIKAANYRFCRAHMENARISGTAFDDWLKKLSDQDLLDAERAFERASIKAANYRFCRAHMENARISGTAMAHGFGGGKSAVRGL